MDMQAQLMLAAQYGWGPGPDSGQPGGTIQVQMTLQVFFLYYVRFQKDLTFLCQFNNRILYLCYYLLKS